MSDFYTPDYFDPMAVSSVRYSYTGAIKAPRTILRDGYISWHDSVTKHWMQLRMFADDVSSKIPHVVDLNNDKVFSRLVTSGMSIRSAIDRVTTTARRLQTTAKAKAVTRASRVSLDRADEAATAHAESWRQQIRRVKAETQPDTPGPRGRKGSAVRGRRR